MPAFAAVLRSRLPDLVHSQTLWPKGRKARGDSDKREFGVYLEVQHSPPRNP